MGRQALKIINAKRVCIGTRQVVFWVTQNVPGNPEPLAPVGENRPPKSGIFEKDTDKV